MLRSSLPPDQSADIAVLLLTSNRASSLLHNPLFYDAVTHAAGSLTNNKLENICKEALMALSWHYPSICLEGGLEKITKSLMATDIPRPDSNRAPSEYTSKVLSLHQPAREASSCPMPD